MSFPRFFVSIIGAIERLIVSELATTMLLMLFNSSDFQSERTIHRAEPCHGDALAMLSMS
jgi:hypothetical protein